MIRSLNWSRTPCDRKAARHFSARGDEGSNVKGGKQSRTDSAEGTSLHGAKRRKIGRRLRSSAGGLSLTAWGFTPKLKQRLQRRRRPLQAAGGRNAKGWEGSLGSFASAMVAKRSLGTPGRRRRGVQVCWMKSGSPTMWPSTSSRMTPRLAGDIGGRRSPVEALRNSMVRGAV